jgi:hypothetical protein
MRPNNGSSKHLNVLATDVLTGERIARARLEEMVVA